MSILVGAVGALLVAAREALAPHHAVHVAVAIRSEAMGREESGVGGQGSGEHGTEAPGGEVIQAPGWIEPAPFAITVPALASGVVSEVLVLEGDAVEAGQIIARMIDDDARLADRAAAAVLSGCVARRSRATAALAAAEAQVGVDRAAHEELLDAITRNRDLVNGGAIAAGEHRRQEIRLAGLAARVVLAESLVEQARAALLEAEAEIASAQARRDEAALRLARMDIKASSGSVVLALLVEPGSRVSAGGGAAHGAEDGGDGSGSAEGRSAVARLYDPSRLQVRVDVPLARAAQVRLGDRAEVTSEALPDRSFEGIVSRIVPEADIQRNTVQFKVSLNSPSPHLKPEMQARVKLRGATAVAGVENADGGAVGVGNGEALLIPIEAIVSVSPGSAAPGEERDRASAAGRGDVWVVEWTTGAPRARRKEVTFSQSASVAKPYVAVWSGLRPTDRVIVEPAVMPLLRDGSRLRVLGERATGHAASP